MGGGGCCVGDFHCCVMDNWLGNLFSSGGCGYHPGPSSDELHAKKIADELAAMKEKQRQSTEKAEGEIIDYINRSMNSLIKELRDLNNQKFGGKTLQLNLKAIAEKNEELKKETVGHIGDLMDERLVLTDKELSVILNERDDKKRNKNFDNFCRKLQKQSLASLKSKVEETVNKQTDMIKKEIDTRLREVNSSMSAALEAYTEILELKKKDEEKLEAAQIRYMYMCGVCDIILDEVES